MHAQCLVYTPSLLIFETPQLHLLSLRFSPTSATLRAASYNPSGLYWLHPQWGRGGGGYAVIHFKQSLNLVARHFMKCNSGRIYIRQVHDCHPAARYPRLSVCLMLIMVKTPFKTSRVVETSVRKPTIKQRLRKGVRVNLKHIKQQKVVHNFHFDVLRLGFPAFFLHRCFFWCSLVFELTYWSSGDFRDNESSTGFFLHTSIL